MLPIIPKVTKLNSKLIGEFGGIDKRVTAKENSFYTLENTDIGMGKILKTKSSFLCTKKYEIPSGSEVITIKGDNSSTDIYWLGEGGFYKNGELLPFKITHETINISWLAPYTKDVEVFSDGTCSWNGDYSGAKLVRYGEYIFAVPQMIVTDGHKTFFWDRFSAGTVYGTRIKYVDGGVVNFTVDDIWYQNVLSGFKEGDEIEAYFNGHKMTGTFTLISNRPENITIKCIKENGDIHTQDSLYLEIGAEMNQMAFKHKSPPEFIDIVVAYNRMWGVCRNRVYASKLAHPFSFDVKTGNEADAWWADTEDSEDFAALGTLNGRVVAFKNNSTYEIYGTVNPFTIKDVSRSLGCIDKNSLCEVNGVLFLLTGEGICVYGGGKFVNINEKIAISEKKLKGVGIGSKFYCLKEDGVFKYDYYTDIWTNICNIKFTSITVIDTDLFGITGEGELVQLTGVYKNFFPYSEPKEREWVIESVEIGGRDFYAEGINRIELRFESVSPGNARVEISRDGKPYELCGSIDCRQGMQIVALPISFTPCSSLKYRVSGKGEILLRLIRYSYRKGGHADSYE